MGGRTHEQRVATFLGAACWDDPDLVPGDAAAGSQPPHPSLERYEQAAQDLVVAYDSAYAPAIRRLAEHFGRPITWASCEPPCANASGGCANRAGAGRPCIPVIPARIQRVPEARQN